MRQVIGFCLVAALTFPTNPTFAAAPTTRPALAAKDSTEFKSPPFGLTFRIPKAWRRLQTSGDPECIFIFTPLPPPKATRTPPKPQAPKTFRLFLGQPCDRQTHLEEVVKDTRNGLARMHPGVTFQKDEATEIAGLKAWTFVWPEKQVATVTEFANGKPTERRYEVSVLRQKTLWLQNNTICDYGVEAEPNSFPAMQKSAAQILDSFQWAQSPQATKAE